MSDKAKPIHAVFVDCKPVKTRSVVQFIFEVPVERADEAQAALGGYPQPKEERWAGIVLLDLSNASESDTGSRGIMNVGLEHHEADKPKRKFDELPIAQRAALLCKREAFWRFLRECKRYADTHWAVEDETSAINALKRICRISSRSELSTDRVAAMRFNELEIQFENWLEGHGF